MAFSFFSGAPTSRKPFRILSLDGGGVRAIIQCTLLKRLVQLFPGFISEIDMFAGTSAGGIVAGALAIGMTPQQTSDLWNHEVSKIFVEGFKRRIGTMDNVIGAAYSAVELERMLTQILGDKTLKELKPKFLSPSFRLNPLPVKENPRWEPVYFHNFAQSDNADARLVDVILRTAAAPTYFPIRDGYVDGGTFANNPALAAVTTAIASGVRPEDISVLSISTGLTPRSVSLDKIGAGDWGLFEWGPHIIDLLLDSTTQSIDYECKCLLNDKYRRLNPLIPFNVELDDASSVPSLIKISEEVDLTAIADWLEKNWVLKRDEVQSQSQTPDSTGWGCSIQ